MLGVNDIPIVLISIATLFLILITDSFRRKPQYITHAYQKHQGKALLFTMQTHDDNNINDGKTIRTTIT